MKIDLNQEELNLLIESVTNSKNDILERLEDEWNYRFPFIDNFSDLTEYLENLYFIKNKLYNYFIANLEVN